MKKKTFCFTISFLDLTDETKQYGICKEKEPLSFHNKALQYGQKVHVFVEKKLLTLSTYMQPKNPLYIQEQKIMLKKPHCCMCNQYSYSHLDGFADTKQRNLQNRQATVPHPILFCGAVI